MKILRLIIATACAGMASFATMSAYAQWKWVDANGVMHYTDSAPPASIPKENVLSRPSGAHIPDRVNVEVPPKVEKDEATKKLEAERQRIADEKVKADAEKKAEDDKKRKEACESAQKSVQRYESGARMRDIGSDGEYYYLTDADIAGRKAKAKKSVKEYCAK